jgi:hypothetical protein
LEMAKSSVNNSRHAPSSSIITYSPLPTVTTGRRGSLERARATKILSV